MTSCILMPAVNKYNAPSNKPQQEVLFDAFWSIPEAETLFASKGLQRGSSDLGDQLDIFIRALSLPRRLADVGITKDGTVCEVAENSMKDICVVRNPRPITNASQLVDILEQCR